MKRFMPVIALSICMAFGVSNAGQTAFLNSISTSVVDGDIDGNGAVNILDMLKMLGVISGDKQTTANTDLNADGKTDISDLILLLGILAGGAKGPIARYTDSTVFYDANFTLNRHFLLIDPGRISNRHISFLDRKGVILKNPGENPARIRVFKDDGNHMNNIVSGARPGFLYMDPNNPGLYNLEDFEFGFFDEMLIGRDYVLENCGVVISFVGYMRDHTRIGVIYQQVDGTWVGSAGAGPEDTLQLKMIKPASLLYKPVAHAAWPLMLRNVYSFSGYSAINQANFNIEICTNQTPPRYDENGMNFLQIFGLDNNGDNEIEHDYIDYTRGLIFFPAFEPFSKPYAEGDVLFQLSNPNDRIYHEENPSLLQTVEYRKYLIKVKYNLVKYGEN